MKNIDNKTLNANMNILCGTHGIDFTRNNRLAFDAIYALERKIPVEDLEEYYKLAGRSNTAFMWCGDVDKRARAALHIFSKMLED